MNEGKKCVDAFTGDLYFYICGCALHCNLNFLTLLTTRGQGNKALARSLQSDHSILLIT